MYTRLIERRSDPIQVNVKAIALRKFFSRILDLSKNNASTICWPSKQKQGTTFTIAKPAENTAIYLQKRAIASGRSGVRKLYFGTQSETSIVL